MSSRIIVVGLFALFTVATVSETVAVSADAARDDTLASWLVACYWALKLAVVAAFTFFLAIREPSRRPAREPVAFLACGAAMGAVVAVQPPELSASAGWLLVGEVITVAGVAWLLVSVLALGRCFGILPEARGLVTRGPYQLVRHPVYLGELVAVAGLVLAAPSTWNVVCFAVLYAAQWTRMGFEERALEREFPEYADYAARTRRLIPRPARAAGRPLPAASAGTN